MWEDAAKKQTPQDAPPPAVPRPQKSSEDYALWAQIILCFLIAAGVLTTRQLGLPLYGDLRIAFDAAMNQPGPELPGWDGDRDFSRFTQEAFAGLAGAAAQLKNAFLATPETAQRMAHHKPSANVASSVECYLPDFPLSFPLPDRVPSWTSGYGVRTDPVGGLAQEFHTGVDLSAAEGTPVLAAADGVVRLAKSHSSYGNYVRILHSDGDETIYAHMQYLFVRQGQRVSAGRQIGTAGQTGNATGPHLHFELLHEGVRYDPTQALLAAD